MPTRRTLIALNARPERSFARIAALLFAALLATSGATPASKVPTVDVSSLDEPVSVRTWLVAGPVNNPDLRPASKEDRWPDRTGFDRDFLTEFGGEAAARPVPGMVVRGANGVRAEFLTYTWNTDYIDLTEIYGRPDDCSAYLYAVLRSDTEQRAFIHFGSNDGAKMWVDGELVISAPLERMARPSQNIVPIALKQGETPVLIRVDQSRRNWGLFFLVSSEAKVHPSRSWQRPVYGYQAPGTTIDRTTIKTIERIVWIAAIGSAFAVVVIGAIIVTVISLRQRQRRESEERALKMRMEMIRQGKMPEADDLPSPTPRTRGAGLLIWGLMLSLGGLGMTIAELAGAGLRNAGLELAILLSGIGLLIAYRLLRRGDGKDAVAGDVG
jgi:hypothetical protein